MAEFQKGDVVRLKSGGPKMTVNDIGIYSISLVEESALCTWFDDKHKLQTNSFFHTLEKWDSPAPLGPRR